MLGATIPSRESALSVVLQTFPSRLPSAGYPAPYRSLIVVCQLAPYLRLARARSLGRWHRDRVDFSTQFPACDLITGQSVPCRSGDT